MLKNYIITAYRKLVKNKLYTLVSMLSLVIGISSCILIGLYIQYETSFDRFHERADRIARVTMEYVVSETHHEIAITGTKVGPQLLRTFPAVENYVRLYPRARIVRYEDRLQEEEGFLYADSTFFSVFSFPLKEGNPQTALSEKDNLLVTESTAKRYFGSEDAVGKVLEVGQGQTFQVAGVVADPPPNSQIQFDFIAPFHAAVTGEEWFPANYMTYLLLQDKSFPGELQQPLSDYMMDVSKNELGMGEGSYVNFELEPLKKVHLYSTLDGLEPNGSITYIYILGSVALLIMLIAGINYTNLATAQAGNRRGEVGVRKAMGAQKGQLFAQMLGESALITLVSLLLGIMVAVQLLPYCNQIAGTQISADALWQFAPLLVLLGLGLLLSLTSGFYPALILSHFRVVDILKNKIHLSSSGGRGRQMLIVSQFSISIILIIATLIIGQQLSYIQHKDLGYDKDQIVVLPVDGPMRSQYEALKDAIEQHPEVISVAGAHDTPTFVKWGDGITVNDEGEEKSLSITGMPVDLDFLTTMNVDLLEGSDFTPADLQKLDTSGNYQNYRYTFILNEAAVKALGWSPEEAVGRTISKDSPGEVKAVVKDFHFSSLHQPIGPLLIFLSPDNISTLLVKVSGANIPATLQFLESFWKERIPHRPFEYHFLDEEYETMYTAEQRTATLFTTFSIIAIILAALGLFALATFTTVQRTKEIGIRKVLGASVGAITALLSSEFIKLVLVALLIAVPVAWYAADRWLQDFAYRIPVQIWVFVVAGVSVVLIAFIAVGYQTIKAALANSVKSLRNE